MSSGQTLDSILDMSFDQIELAAKCIYKHKMDMINMVLEPVASAFGGKKVSSRKKIRAPKTKEPQTKEYVERKEQHKLDQLKLLGIGVRDI